MIVAAHPDDETLGAGGHFHEWSPILIVHVTSGAPASRTDREAYRDVRRRELYCALNVAGVPPSNRFQLGGEDQGTSFYLAQFARELSAVIGQTKPSLILTHPYEGGHPDHDSTAWITQAALRLSGVDSQLAEFASYHNNPPYQEALMTVGTFLPGGPPEVVVSLTDLQIALKQRMLNCFESQREMVIRFPGDQERFRLAPAYDFGQPPHPGLPFYDSQDWGIRSEEWRRLAMQATAELEQDPAFR
jgi:LmbE family N-acetylglucosaminyl deacetylase